MTRKLCSTGRGRERMACQSLPPISHCPLVATCSGALCSNIPLTDLHYSSINSHPKSDKTATTAVQHSSLRFWYVYMRVLSSNYPMVWHFAASAIQSTCRFRSRAPVYTGGSLDFTYLICKTTFCDLNALLLVA